MEHAAPEDQYRPGNFREGGWGFVVIDRVPEGNPTESLQLGLRSILVIIQLAENRFGLATHWQLASPRRLR